MPRHAFRQSQAGYSLVEISFAVLVLGIGLTSLLAIFPTAISWAGKAMSNTTGALAARTAAAKVATDFSDGGDGAVSGDWELPDNDGGEGLQAGAYYATYEVADADGDATVANLKCVTIQVHRKLTNDPSYNASTDLLGTFQTYLYDSHY